VLRRAIVGRDTGSDSLSTSYVTIAPGATKPVHLHQVEEAMFLSEGEGLAILGDETFPIKAPATLLAPPGVKHGFINNNSAPMVVSGIFPAVDVEHDRSIAPHLRKTTRAGGIMARLQPEGNQRRPGSRIRRSPAKLAVPVTLDFVRHGGHHGSYSISR
jgi:quercetin dioxygenase-like cupin family protein